MSSQESNASTGSKLNLSLSQDTVDYMMNSVGDIDDPGSVCDFTNLCPRDLSLKKEDSIDKIAMKKEREIPDKDQNLDRTTTNRSHHGDSPTVNRQQPTSPATVSLSVSLPALPSTTACNGEYGFKVTLSMQSKETKAVDWTYSEKLSKVFVRFDASCPFLFTSSTATPHGCVIRATPMFSQPQHMHQVVRRCPHHAAMSTAGAGDGGPPSDHLIRCDHKLATYHEDLSTGFHSVCLPGDILPGVWTSYLYQFTCFSSCAGGLNRRPFQVMFTLEDAAGQVLGRNDVEVRICACPGRDRQIEEKNTTSSQVFKPHLSPASSTTSSAAAGVVSDGPTAKRRRLNCDTEDVFTVMVCGSENFALLSQLRDSLEVSSAIPRLEFQHLRSLHEMKHRSHPTSTMPPPLTTEVALPRDSVQELSTEEQAHLTHNGVVSADVNGGRSTVKRKYSCENRIETWLLQHKMSSCIEVFRKLNLVYMKQLDSFKLQDFEKLGLPEDDLAKAWLAFSRLQCHINNSDHSAMNGSV